MRPLKILRAVSLNQAAKRLYKGIPHAEMLAVLKTAYDAERSRIYEEFYQKSDSLRALHRQSLLMDGLIGLIYHCARKTLSREVLTIVATGGYGRGELFPFSDIDLMFLHDGRHPEKIRHVAEYMLYFLWDMGLKVGHATRTPDEMIEAAFQDITICTSLLDSRLICGNSELFEHSMQRFWNEVAPEASTLGFVEAKLAEREKRHEKAGGSRYVLEPKIKEGKGGLRDVHLLHWLARHAYRISHPKELVKLGVLQPQEYNAYAKAHLFLSTVRIYIHLLAGHAEERLTFDLQREVAERMGYRARGDVLAVERFMKAYFLTAKTIGNLSNIFCAVLEDERKRKPRRSFASLFFNNHNLNGFSLEGERIAAGGTAFFYAKPVRLIELFALAQQHNLEIHPRTFRLVSRLLHLINPEIRADKEANQLFMQILTSRKRPDTILRLMNESGVLGKFIPDFGRIVGQMQFDMYHVYTVDEHTIFAIGILNRIAHGDYPDMPVASRLIHRIASVRVLYLSLFCHDIAKGRGSDHSILGEKVIRKLAGRFGFNAEETETCAWLVREHLLFSRTAFKRDITEEKTVADFVARVQSPERLRLLLILTVADIRAVGPQVWNSWKGGLLRELYFRAETRMGVSEDWGGMNNGAFLLPAFSEALPKWSIQERAEYLALGNEHYYRGLELTAHLRIAHLLKEAAANPFPFITDWLTNEVLSVTELLVITADRKGLFTFIAGALTSIGANIVGAKIFTLKNGMAIDQFYIQNMKGEPFTRADRMKQFEQLLKEGLVDDGNLDWQKLDWSPKPLSHAGFDTPARVIIENTVSSYHTVIEINGRDRLGFLFTITRAILELGLNISTAHISSYGERAVDVFYVKDRFGMKLQNENLLKQVREKLLQVLEA